MYKENVTVIFIAVILCARPLYAEDIETNRIDEEQNNASKTERNGRSLHKECNNGLSPKCLKIRVLSFLEDLSSREELNLLPGLSIVKENQTNVTSPEEMAVELARQFPGKPEEKLNRFLLYRLQNYLDGHSLRYRLLDTETSKEALNMAKGDKESTGRKKDGGFGGGKGGGGALLAAALMMKGTLAAAALGALALLAGKALMTALMSLLLSAIVGLKGSGGHKSTTYEIITKPEYSHQHSHSHEEHHEHEHDHGHHGGYRRAYDTNYNNYNSYMPYDTTNNYKLD
ncbi:uncharacterized protein [Maniola hyperantus]|uniref:uncharacterized protein n=1 Tax=Aphantopus hyperantus TaxID=2795564 RepID=UPI00156928CC|nr:uncharacterized protein LOC117993415 [Maniola hyperantus]